LLWLPLYCKISNSKVVGIRTILVCTAQLHNKKKKNNIIFQLVYRIAKAQNLYSPPYSLPHHNCKTRSQENIVWSQFYTTYKNNFTSGMCSHNHGLSAPCLSFIFNQALHCLYAIYPCTNTFLEQHFYMPQH